MQADADTITLKYTFKREHLGPAGVYVFEHPSTIFTRIREMLIADDAREQQWRASDGARIADSIRYLQEKLKQVSGLNGLVDRMDETFYRSTIKYLAELGQRRLEIDKRMDAAEKVRKAAEEDEIRRKVEEEIKRREHDRAQAKKEAHERWAREQEEKEKTKRRWTPPPGFGSFSDQESARTFWKNFADYINEDDRDKFDGMFTGWYGERRQQAPPPPAGSGSKWFEILGCAPGASRDEIRRAAREAAKGLHPDKNKNPADAEKFKTITEAKAEGLQGCR
jgi:hypothetical protein